MEPSYRSTMLATALVLAGLVTGAGVVAAEDAETNARTRTDPGFNPGTGQINPGVPEREPPSIAPRRIPTPDEARAAFMSHEPNPAESDKPTVPPGATPQTMPATLSKRNDTLDRLPTMAWPMALSDEQRRRIYDAVMADAGANAPDAAALAPADQLSTSQALNGMKSLPSNVADIAGLASLKYLKTNDKVLLVEPDTRIVVEQITR